MALPWFRFYSEFSDDPKVQMLSEAMQRRLVMLLCDRCKGEAITDGMMAFRWRVPPVDVQETKSQFMAQGFIDENWNLLNWDKRQYISDNSTFRTQKYRRKLQVIKPMERHGNVTVTPPDTDRDSYEEDSPLKGAFS